MHCESQKPATITERLTARLQIIKTDISPALYHLLSNLNAAIDSNDGSGISPGRMRDYIADVVETWTASATVLVQNKQRDWEYYTGEFGKESWQRISDRTVRYEVGLHFAIGMLNCDQAAYKVGLQFCAAPDMAE